MEKVNSQIRTGLELRDLERRGKQESDQQHRTNKKPRSENVALHFYCKMWSNILSWCMDSLIL